MSWEQQAYRLGSRNVMEVDKRLIIVDNSFGNPNAQPPTPTQTPTSGVFSSPTFQTPRANKTTSEDHSGWTPTFAEEYSVFNATPGRLISTGGTFGEIATPRPSTGSSQNGPLSHVIDLEAEIASHVHYNVQTDLFLPPVDPSRQLSSSPQEPPAHGTRSNAKKATVTPRKPRRRLEEAFSGQTATPPKSASKTSRKLAPKPGTETMQRDPRSIQQSSAAQGNSNALHLSNGPDDMFAFPASGPVTAPIYMDGKSFWDPDSSMSGMNMDMDFMAADCAPFDSTTSQRPNSSAHWGGNNLIFEDITSMQSLIHDDGRGQGHQHPMASRAPMSSAPQGQSGTAFSYGGSTLSEDPFAMTSTSDAVNPGLLFTFSDAFSPITTDSKTNDSVMAYSQPSMAPLVREPYQHQQRESRRDQEEYLRLRASKEKSRVSFSSPAKLGDRPGLKRSASVNDSRAKIVPTRRSNQLSNSRSRTSDVGSRPTSNRGRSSPIKHQSQMSLSSIPESVLGTRTALTFSIDANGRARTETKIIVEEPMALKRRAPSVKSEEYGSSHSDSSTDEDEIVVPSRNTSFSVPSKRSQPKFSRFETSQPPIERGQHSFDVNASFNMGRLPDDQESEAETVMDDYDGAGDATDALRKAMETRKQSIGGPGNSRHHMYSNNPARGGPSFRGHVQTYYNSASPTTVSDPDLTSPSTDRDSSISDSTRCVCGARDGEGFMIQW